MKFNTKYLSGINTFELILYLIFIILKLSNLIKLIDKIIINLCEILYFVPYTSPS